MGPATSKLAPIFYAAIVLLSVTISGYLSYHGLLSLGNEITLGLVVLLMGSIAFLDMAIRHFRAAGKRAWIGVFFVWIFAAFFSVASGFNHLYTNFMAEDVARTSVTEQLQVFRDDLVSTKSTLLSADAYRQAVQTRTALAVEMDNLHQQINDPLRPGCGEECRSHLTNIEQILGKPITNLAIPPIGSRPDVVEEWYLRYRNAAENQLETTLASTDYAGIVELVDEIDDTLLEFPAADYVIAQKGGLSALSEMSAVSADIMRRANAVLPEARHVQHEPIDPGLGRLGEIAYSFQNGFVEMPNPMATAISFIVAIVVDVLPLLIAFTLFGPGKLEQAQQTRAPRSAGGRRIISGTARARD